MQMDIAKEYALTTVLNMENVVLPQEYALAVGDTVD